jgi:hypothetical protein
MTEEEWVAGLEPELLAAWTLLEDLWEIGRAFTTAAVIYVPTPGVEPAAAIPPWKRLSPVQKVRFFQQVVHPDHPVLVTVGTAVCEVAL